ncbi:MAG: WYL domain-containing protein, partial [Prevotella sp.]|nr:WYL domain-containing protein [Prevotella sp.]
MKESKKYHYYTWLVTTLLNCKGLTLEQLNRRWMNEEVADGNPLARTTFNRYRDGVLEMFGLIIDCD